MAVLVPFWIAIVAFVIGAVAVEAWRDRDPDDRAAIASRTPSPAGTSEGTPAPEPTSPRPPATVDQRAQLVQRHREFGATSETDRDVRLFFNLECADDLMRLTTSREFIYAEVDCDQYTINDDTIRPLLGKPIRITIDPAADAQPAVLVISSPAGAPRFEAKTVWIGPH